MEAINGVVSGMKSPNPKPTSPHHLISPRNKATMGNQRIVEEMRAHIAKLKQELEAEKAKNKQLHRDKIAEIRQLKEGFDRERERSVQSLLIKCDQEKLNELQKLRDNLSKEKDVEIRGLLRSQEEDLKQLRQQAHHDKEMAVKAAMEIQKRALAEQKDGPATNTFGRLSPGNSALIVKLQREIKALKDAKKELETELDRRSAADQEQKLELKKIKKLHEAELKRINNLPPGQEVSAAECVPERCSVGEDQQPLTGDQDNNSCQHTAGTEPGHNMEVSPVGSNKSLDKSDKSEKSGGSPCNISPKPASVSQGSSRKSSRSSLGKFDLSLVSQHYFILPNLTFTWCFIKKI